VGEFLKNWIIWEATNPFLSEERVKSWRLLIGISFGLFLAALLIFWFLVSTDRDFIEWIAGLVIILITLILGSLFLSTGIVRGIALWLRNYQQRKTHTFLNGPLRERHLQEREAALIWQAWRSERRGIITNVLRANLWWLPLDSDSQGKRLLVQPAFAPGQLRALIGEDPVSGDFFFMALPPSISTVNEALEWLWDLPSGFWNDRDEIHEV